MPVRYQNIDAATTAMNYGTLVGEYAKRHACGFTNTDVKVWLPIMYDPDNNWYNMYGCKNSKELIVQIANKPSAVKDWHIGVLIEDTAHVVVRTNNDGKTYEYEDIGEYCPVLFDSKQYITVHAKLGAPVTSGKILQGNGLYWVSGFAASEHEAQNKLNTLAAKTIEELKKLN